MFAEKQRNQYGVSLMALLNKLMSYFITVQRGNKGRILDGDKNSIILMVR